MDELIQQLRQLGLLDDDQLRQLSALNDQPREALDALEAVLVDLVAPLVENPEDADEDAIAAGGALVEAVEAVRRERDGRPSPVQLVAGLAERIGELPRGRAAVRAPLSRLPRRPQATSRLTDRNGAEVEDLAAAFRRALAESRDRKGARRLVATAHLEYPEDRQLGGDSSANAALIAAAAGPEALTASGGLCAPTGARYEVPVIATPARPLRDSLPDFNADRGGIRFVPSPVLADLAAGVVEHTVADDEASATKPCVRVTCPDETEVLLAAIARCVEFGNFHERTHPEGVAANLAVLLAQHARLAEDTLWTAMVAASTAVTTGQVLGTARDVLENVAQAGSQYRSRHRMEADAVLRFAAPAWLRDMMRADLVRQLPGDDTMGVADARIAGFLAAAHVEPVWSLDATQAFGAQGGGALLGWPTTVETLLYHEGAFLFLDGGTLDLGVVRDSTLNSTNDAQAFAETFEAVAFVGVEALAITMDLCPDGSSSGAVDVDPCVIGS